MDNADEKNTEDNPILCRISPLMWAIVGLMWLLMGLLMGAFLTASYRAQSDKGIALVFLGCILSITLTLSCRILRCRVIANQKGIQWRGLLHGWRSVSWSEVSDYYQEPKSIGEGGKITRTITVVTSRGNVCISDDWTNDIAFQEYVRKYALQARVSEWERKGVRRIDTWPRTFTYWDSVWLPRVTASLIVLMIAIGFAVKWSWKFAHSLAQTMGWEQTMPAVYALVTAGFFVLGMSSIFYGRYVIAYRRRGERFTVSPESLTYENKRTAQQLTVPWSDIVDYHYVERSEGLQHRHYTLVLSGAEERQLIWSPMLRESDLLIAIVQRYAPRPSAIIEEQEGWRAKSKHEQTGGSDPATWKSGAVGLGDRVFAYNTPINIVACAMFLFMGGALLVACMNSQDKPAHSHFPVFFLVGLAILLGAPALWGLVCSLRSRVEVDSMGITHYTPFGKKHLYWYAVESYKRKGTSASQRTSSGPNYRMEIKGRDGTRILFWDNIRSYHELSQEVRRLAPPAAEIVPQQHMKETVRR